MENKIITKDNIFIQTTDFLNLLLESNNYDEFYKNIQDNHKDFDIYKTYEVAFSNFIDFNQHMYEDINHLNSINAGIFIEKTIVTFRIFVWSSVGEGFEIFKHILRADEISNIVSQEDVKNYIKENLLNLQEGILSTYSNNDKDCFEMFGASIESKKLPLVNILKFINLENNLDDLK